MQCIPLTHQLLNFNSIKSVRIYALHAIKTCWSNIDSKPIATASASLPACEIPFLNQLHSFELLLQFFQQSSFKNSVGESHLPRKMGIVAKSDSHDTIKHAHIYNATLNILY